MGSSVISPEDVLESLMNDGAIDAIRLKIINQPRANEIASNLLVVETGKGLLLKTPVLERASKSVWELMLDNNGLGKEISETVEKVFCRLSGSEPPLFPSLSIEGQAEKEQEDLNSPSKKRSFSKVSVDGGADEVVDLSSNYLAMPEDRNPVPSSSGQT
nr:uncharacterized protein LOC111986314 [Quercus suber]